MTNDFTQSFYDPRHEIHALRGRLFRMAYNSMMRDPARYARAIPSRIENYRWRGFSKRLSASLRGNTYSKPSKLYADHRAIFDSKTHEFLGWRSKHGFCPAGE